MKIEKEHKKSTLMRWDKERLVEYILCLEHNNNVINESFDIQYANCLRIVNDMNILNDMYKKRGCEDERKNI